jgi:hypothetical protein
MKSVFHFCAMAQLDISRTAYSDGCHYPKGEIIDLGKIRQEAAEAIGNGVKADQVTLLSLTRLVP